MISDSLTKIAVSTLSIIAIIGTPVSETQVTDMLDSLRSSVSAKTKIELVLVNLLTANQSFVRRLPPRVEELSNQINVRIFERFGDSTSAAMNFAITQCEGEYVSFLRCNSFWLPTKTAWQLRHLNANPQDAMVSGLSYKFDDPEARTAKIAVKAIYGEPSQGLTFASCLIRKRAFECVGLLTERLAAAAESDWIMRLRESRAGVAHVERPALLEYEPDSEKQQNTPKLNPQLYVALKASLDRRRGSK